MKVRITMFAFVMACALALPANQVFSQEKGGGKNEAKPAVDMQEMMKKWAEAAKPGAPHRLLDQFVGQWDVAMRMWMEPGKPPMETKSTADVKWIMDGRFLLEESTGQIMGMPHKGMGITGYDNFKQKYISSWIENMSTGMYTSEGTFDQSGKVLTLHGKIDEPMTGERDKLVRFVARFISKDKHVFEIYDLVGRPDEFKAVEMTYTRKQ
jgi:hypothetical protein